SGRDQRRDRGPVVGGRAAVVACRRRRTDVVGVGTAKGEQGLLVLLRSCNEVVLQLAPLVPRDLRMNQVVPLEEQPEAQAREPLIGGTREWRRQAQVELVEGRPLSTHANHGTSTTVACSPQGLVVAPRGILAGPRWRGTQHGRREGRARIRTEPKRPDSA